jgi:probable HAF family extracellular repeat protein
MVDLGTLAGDFSYGMAINANNHVAGYSTIDTDNDRVHAFLYDGQTMIDLGSLCGGSLDLDFSYALGVNSADQVVGYSYLPWGDASMDVPSGPWPVAFIYSDGVMLDLNDLIGDAAKNYRLDCATAINDHGQIAAIAFDQSAHAFHAVLLTPLSRESLVQAPGSKPRRMPPIVAPIPGAKPRPTPLGPPMVNPGIGSRK